MNTMCESLKDEVRGDFKMIIKNRAGEIVDSYSDHNMIVNGAKNAMAKLVSEGADPDDTSSKVITQFGVGTGTADPAKTDTTLTDVYKKDISSHTFPTENGVTLVGRVTFHWSLDYDDTGANDKTITEFGLFCKDGTLFAHKVRSSGVYKDADLAFEGDWTIIF